MNHETPESHDPAWALLERATRVEPRPDFVEKVAEAVKREKDAQSPTPLWPRLRRLTRPAAATAAAASIAVLAWWGARPEPRVASPPVAAVPAADLVGEISDEIAQDLAMLDEVDELLAPEDAQDLSEEELETLLF